MYFFAVIVITITICIVIAIVITRKRKKNDSDSRHSHGSNAIGLSINPLYGHAGKVEGIYEELNLPPEKK